MNIKKTVQSLVGWAYYPLRRKQVAYCKKQHVKKETNRLNKLGVSDEQPRVFYLGITEQPNLGDMAQHYCILKWISENYPNHELVKFESSTVTDKRFNFVERFRNIYRPDKDIIIFQSGYCTQDLGGDHELMHRLICDNLPDAHILMMPQTIYFQHHENKERTAKSYNGAKNMLFLARDFISYDMAKEMFPDIAVKAYPDIVTTLIGTFEFMNKRNGVCLCTRNDGEKYYTDEQLAYLASELEKTTTVHRKDTQGKAPFKTIRENLQHFIEEEIESYSHYDVTITDRYHGTIFSLCAGTPVIIIKTTDHKVTTGADWFKGIYDDYVYVAKDLDNALDIYGQLMQKNLSHRLMPHMKNEYYDKLKSLLEGI